jgi:putative membrane protein
VSGRARVPRGAGLQRALAAGSTALALATFTSCVAAHSVEEAARGLRHLEWSFEPWVVACLALSAFLYARGVQQLWAHAGRGRGVGALPVTAFVSGWLALVVALVSPLDAMGSDLFAAHMVQHELLMIVAAPLLVCGRPVAVWAWALPLQWRRAIGRFFHTPAWRRPWLILTGPLVAWTLHAAALWLWHVPALFDAALRSDAVHALQHSCFLLTALLFWWSVFGGVTRKEQGIALLSLFTTMAHTGALGALLALSRTPWYAPYAAAAPAYGLDALQDQQLGGLIMWVPAGFVYIGCGLVLAARWLSAGGKAGKPTLAIR